MKEVVFKVVETCQNNKNLQIIRAQCLVQVSIGYVGKIFGSNVRVFWNLKRKIKKKRLSRTKWLNRLNS